MNSLNYCRSSISLFSKLGELGLGIVNFQVETFQKYWRKMHKFIMRPSYIICWCSVSSDINTI